MNSLKRNKRYLYLCKRDNNADYEKYLEPVQKAYNYSTISAEATIENTGEISRQYIVIKDIPSNLKDISIGDRLYISSPETFDDRCTDADYQVVAKAENLTVTEVECKLLSGEQYGYRS